MKNRLRSSSRSNLDDTQRKMFEAVTAGLNEATLVAKYVYTSRQARTLRDARPVQLAPGPRAHTPELTMLCEIVQDVDFGLDLHTTVDAVVDRPNKLDLEPDQRGHASDELGLICWKRDSHFFRLLATTEEDATVGDLLWLADLDAFRARSDPQSLRALRDAIASPQILTFGGDGRFLGRLGE